MKRGEIISFASRKCKLCFGRGAVTVVEGASRELKLCGCAIRRWEEKGSANCVYTHDTGEWFRKVPIK